MKLWQRFWIILALCTGAAVHGCGSDTETCADRGECLLTSSSSGFVSSSSGSSTGNMPSPEDCTNGLDDDKDGSIDCMDSDCADKYTCLPNIPAGFTEIVTLSVAPFGEAVSGCGGGVMPSLYYQNPAVDACDACTCDVSGVSCTPGQIASDSFLGKNCMNPQPIAPLAQGECRQIFTSSVILQSAATSMGACKANTSTAPPKPPMETTVAVCSVGQTSGKGCGMSGACAPSDGLSTAEHICIKRSGHEVCPGGWPLALYAFESYIDDRTGCTPCGCSASCTGGDYKIFTNGDTTCTNGGISVNTVGQCVDGGGSFNLTLSMTPLMPSCTTTGGEMMGSVKPMNETTFCCF